MSRAVTKGATGKAGNRAAKTLRITQSEDNRLNEYGGYWAYGCRNLGINKTFSLDLASTPPTTHYNIPQQNTQHNTYQHIPTHTNTHKKKTKKGGGAGYRSLCLVHAKHALYHLSYTPSIDSQSWRWLTRVQFVRHIAPVPAERKWGRVIDFVNCWPYRVCHPA